MYGCDATTHSDAVDDPSTLTQRSVDSTDVHTSGYRPVSPAIVTRRIHAVADSSRAVAGRSGLSSGCSESLAGADSTTRGTVVALAVRAASDADS